MHDNLSVSPGKNKQGQYDKEEKNNNDVTKLKVLTPDSKSMTLAYEMFCLCLQTGL